MLPNFMLIGPGRAGSDWITTNLRQHPDIFIPRQKVTRFFLDEYDRGLDWYSNVFGNRSESAVGEATVGYLHTPHSPGLIARHLPDIKLIANLRDPVERSFSSFSRLNAKARPGDENFNLTFEEKLERTPRLLEQSMYGEHLQRWLEYFPRENFLLLTFDEMKSDPDAFLKRIFQFLQVDDSFRSPIANLRLNASSTIGARSKGLYKLYRGLLRLDLFRFSQALDRVNQTERPTLNPETRRRLIDEVFMEDIEKLEALLGKELKQWKK